MASSMPSGSTRRHDRLSSADHDLDPTTHHPHSTTHHRHRPTIRRKRTKAKPSPISAMSLVGLKNLFFKQTWTPVPARRSEHSSKSASPLGVYWSYGSQEPLLAETNALPQNSPTISQAETDLESQSVDSKNEKINTRRGFRVDARIISDATIGLSDGLTVPFALTAGLSALGNTKVVVYGGFAELIAGAISMGLGGYLGAKSEAYVSPYRAKYSAS